MDGLLPSFSTVLHARPPKLHSINGIDIPSVTQHEKFTFDDEKVVFLVDGVSYTIHSYFFERDSAWFRARFTEPHAEQLPSGWELRRTVHGRPFYVDHNMKKTTWTPPAGTRFEKHVHPAPVNRTVALEHVSPSEFDAFLSILYPSDFDVGDVTTLEDWSAVLKLATMWSFHSIRTLAIRHLDPLLDRLPFERLLLSRAHGVTEWVRPALIHLCERSATLRSDEIRKMNADDVALVVEVKDNVRAMMKGELVSDMIEREVTRLCAVLDELAVARGTPQPEDFAQDAEKMPEVLDFQTEPPKSPKMTDVGELEDPAVTMEQKDAFISEQVEEPQGHPHMNGVAHSVAPSTPVAVSTQPSPVIPQGELPPPTQEAEAPPRASDTDVDAPPPAHESLRSPIVARAEPLPLDLPAEEAEPAVESTAPSHNGDATAEGSSVPSAQPSTPAPAEASPLATAVPAPSPPPVDSGVTREPSASSTHTHRTSIFDRFLNSAVTAEPRTGLGSFFNGGKLETPMLGRRRSGTASTSNPAEKTTSAEAKHVNGQGGVNARPLAVEKAVNEVKSDSDESGFASATASASVSKKKKAGKKKGKKLQLQEAR